MTLIAETASHRSGSGTVLSSSDWLDSHFEACRASYEKLSHFANFQPGWRVLDAGCGSGSFGPLLRESVGAEGRIVGVDLDLENVAKVAQACVEDAAVGDVRRLPFLDDAFAAVWCANVTQYFDDASLIDLLRELQRVVRPGGSVAVKDVDMSALRIYPGDPLLGARLAEACRADESIAARSQGSLRGRELRRWLERAGLRQVSQQSLLVEYWAPLDAASTRLWSGWLSYLARLALRYPLPQAQREAWLNVSTAERAESFVCRPDFYACELQVVAVGQVHKGAL